MKILGRTFLVLSWGFALATSSSAFAVDVHFPCGGASFPSCTGDKSIVGLFQSSVSSETFAKTVQNQVEGVYKGIWSQRKRDAKGNYPLVPDPVPLTVPACSRVPLDTFAKDSPAYCKSENGTNHLNQNCGPFGLVNSNANGFVSFQLQMKTINGLAAGRESSEFAGMFAVALANYYHTLLKQVTETQTISVPTEAAGCVVAAGDLNAAIEVVKNNPNLNTLMQGCPVKNYCPQQSLQEAYIHLQRSFLGLAECVAFEATLTTNRSFKSAFAALLDGFAKDCGNQFKADKYRANQCYQKKYAEKIDAEIGVRWPNAAGGCK